MTRFDGGPAPPANMRPEAVRVKTSRVDIRGDSFSRVPSQAARRAAPPVESK